MAVSGGILVWYLQEAGMLTGWKERALVVAVAFVVGCSTPGEKRAKEAESLARAQEEIAERAQARENARKAKFLDEVPEWVLKGRAADATGVYAVGSAESDKLTTAMRMAELQAQYGLAAQVAGELSGSERMFEEDRGAGKPMSQYRQLIDKLVAEVPVVGLETVEREVKPIAGRYHAFVLLKLPYEEFNRALQARRAKAVDSTVEAAFKDLERRIDKRREAYGTPQMAPAPVLIQEGPRVLGKADDAASQGGVVVKPLPQ